jgi:hypothetical protein
LLFALCFTGLMLLHAPLLRLPYFWDEAGYYIPAARDLLFTRSLIPHSTPSNAHPPLVMAWLALAWRGFGYSTLVTRTAMLALSAFSLLGLFRLASVAANTRVAAATTILVALYPVYFTQSCLAQVDLPAAGLTFWALAAYLEDHPRSVALWLTLAALTKETAILAAVALFGWEAVTYLLRRQGQGERWQSILPPQPRRTNAWHLLFPVFPLAAWYAYHYFHTGFLLGNPEFVRYNLSATMSPMRIPLAFAMRLWQLFGYFSLYLLTLAGALAMLQPARRDNNVSRPRIPFWVQAILAMVVLTYLVFMSVVGGALLARYLLPVTPLVVLMLVSTLFRRARHCELILGAIALGFVAGLFSNPPYGFSLEDNLAYRDYIVLHTDACRFLALQYPGARVLTAWPASDELSRPWLGYVDPARAFRVSRIEDFSLPQIDLAIRGRAYYDVILVFSTKYQPDHALLGLDNWSWWQLVKQKYFGYHRDLSPEDVAQKIGGTVAYHKEVRGQWVAAVALP